MTSRHFDPSSASLQTTLLDTSAFAGVYTRTNPSHRMPKERFENCSSKTLHGPDVVPDLAYRQTDRPVRRYITSYDQPADCAQTVLSCDLSVWRLTLSEGR